MKLKTTPIRIMVHGRPTNLLWEVDASSSNLRGHLVLVQRITGNLDQLKDVPDWMRIAARGYVLPPDVPEGRTIEVKGQLLFGTGDFETLPGTITEKAGLLVMLPDGLQTLRPVIVCEELELV